MKCRCFFTEFLDSDPYSPYRVNGTDALLFEIPHEKERWRFAAFDVCPNCGRLLHQPSPLWSSSDLTQRFGSVETPIGAAIVPSFETDGNRRMCQCDEPVTEFSYDVGGQNRLVRFPRCARCGGKGSAAAVEIQLSDSDELRFAAHSPWPANLTTLLGIADEFEQVVCGSTVWTRAREGPWLPSPLTQVSADF